MNHLVDNMMKTYEEVTMEWIKECDAERQITYGGTGFNGNACRKLLAKVDNLRRLCNQSENNADCLEYVDVLQKFNSVVDECFGMTLKPNFKRSIRLFKEAYLLLNISVTPKVHAVFFHVEEFCDKHGKSLGFFSEQAVETVHSDFYNVWSKYKVFKKHSKYNAVSLNGA